MFITNEDYEVMYRRLEVMQGTDNFIAIEKPNYDNYIKLRRKWLQTLKAIKNTLSEAEEIAEKGSDNNE